MSATFQVHDVVRIEADDVRRLGSGSWVLNLKIFSHVRDYQHGTISEFEHEIDLFGVDGVMLGAIHDAINDALKVREQDAEEEARERKYLDEQISLDDHDGGE